MGTLHKIIVRGDIDEFNAHLKNPEADLNETDYRQQTPLHYTCLHDRVEMARILMNNVMVDVNKKDSNCLTPFHFACIHNRSKIVILMLKNAKVEVNPIHGLHSVVMACAWKRTYIVNLLIGSSRIDVHKPNTHGRTPLSMMNELIQMKKLNDIRTVIDHHLSNKKIIKDFHQEFLFASADGNVGLMKQMMTKRIRSL